MKILKMVGTIAALFIVALVLFWRFAPPSMIKNAADNIGPARSLLCRYPVKVRGEAMMPIFQNDERITLSKCIEDRVNIEPGVVVLYERPGGIRLSVVRERMEDANGVFYRVSQEARREEIDDVRPDRILAVYYNGGVE
mgnify:CR=1 FL=1